MMILITYNMNHGAIQKISLGILCKWIIRYYSPMYLFFEIQITAMSYLSRIDVIIKGSTLLKYRLDTRART